MVDRAAGSRQRRCLSSSGSSRAAVPVPPQTGEVLEALYRCEYSGVLAYLRRQVGFEAASDLAQEVFMRAASSEQLLDLHKPSAFLRRIARNLVIDFRRRQRCRIVAIPIVEAAHIGCRGEQEDRLLAGDAERWLHDTLAGLPPKTALVFAMSRFDDKSYRTIQNELGVGLSTVEYHMMKALAHLRSELGDRDSSASDQIISFETKVAASPCVLP